MGTPHSGYGMDTTTSPNQLALFEMAGASSDQTPTTNEPTPVVEVYQPGPLQPTLW